MDLIFRAAPLSVRTVLTALQNQNKAQGFYTTAAASESSTNTQMGIVQVPQTPAHPRAPSRVEMTEHWQPKVESSSILHVAVNAILLKSSHAKQQQECCLLLQGRSLFSAAQQSCWRHPSFERKQCASRSCCFLSAR